jgi:hypothetical protein
MFKQPLRITLAAAALTAASAVTLPALASASTTPQSFTQAQQKLEQQLAFRVSQLGRLSSDVSSSKTLTPADANVLSARLATESTSVTGLVAKVPGDTTFAELHSDELAMVKDNRVFAVETPQVIQIIESDAIASQATTLAASEPSLLASVESLTGEPGYKTAMAHYEVFVKAVTRAATVAANVNAPVLAQVPSDFPGDTHVFVAANRALLAGDIALAHASYDESIIGLASGGYTGS